MIQVHGRPTPVLPSPTPRKLVKANGACSVCGLIRKIHFKNGKVYLHGSRRKRCIGSNQLPVADSSKHDPSSSQGGLSEAGSQRTTSVDLTTSVLVESAQKRIIFHPEPKSRILKHIPKAARSCTGRLLTTIINKILADPSTLHHWQVLLSFAAIVLEQPMRGGKRHNLTSTIKKQTEDFFHTWRDKGALVFDQQHGEQQHGETRGLLFLTSIRKIAGPRETARTWKTTPGQQRSLRNWRKGISLQLCAFSAQMTNLLPETLEELRLKHPSPPVDHQLPPPPPLAIHLQVTEAEVTSRVRTFPAGSSGGPDGLRPQHINEL